MFDCFNLSKGLLRVRAQLDANWRRFQVTLPVAEYKFYQIDPTKGPKMERAIAKEEALSMYTDMMHIRTMENNLATLYRQQRVRGFCHLCNGQEAIAVAIFHRMRAEDTVITSYRAHGFCFLMSGKKSEPILAELMGLEAGCSKGKGGSMHVYAPRFYGGNGIVGAQIPLGTGAALAHKYNGTKAVSFTVYGDGAANQGQAFESFNIAKLWNLPVIYVIENNLYGMGTSTRRSSADVNYYTKCAYLPGLLVDGMDILSVCNAVDYAIQWITDGRGPLLIEMRTYRYFGHSLSDPGTSYRSRDEVANMRKERDPVQKFHKILVENKIVTKEELDAIKKDINKQVKASVKKLLTLKPCSGEHLSADVVKLSLEDDIRGVNMLKTLKHKNFPPPP